MARHGQSWDTFTLAFSLSDDLIGLKALELTLASADLDERPGREPLLGLT